MFNPICNHPGCHRIYGNDDPLFETPFSTLSTMVKETLRQAEIDSRPAMKVALLNLAEALIRGEGGREAYRQVRVASLHNFTFAEVCAECA